MPWPAIGWWSSRHVRPTAPKPATSRQPCFRLAALDWLSPLDSAAHTEYQTDRFTVAFDLKDTTEFQFAYMARAIAPGSFNQPAATIEDMYRPERQARTGAGHVEVIGPLQ